MTDKTLFTEIALYSALRILEAKTKSVLNAIKRFESDSKHEEINKEAFQSQIDRLNQAYDFYEKKDLEYLRRFLQAEVILENWKSRDEFLERFTNVIPPNLSEEEKTIFDSAPEENEAVSENMDDEEIEESALVQELNEIKKKIEENDEDISRTMEKILNSMKFVAEIPDLSQLKN